MNAKKLSWLGIAALTVVCLPSVQVVRATTSVTFPSGVLDPALPTYADETDYSPSGLNLGKDGYLFFNFDASTDSGNDPVGDDRADTLPSWIGVEYDPIFAAYSFGTDPGQETYSRGGVTTWASITLPDGIAPGLSGALVDPAADDNSDSAIYNLAILPGAPSSFWMHVVTDNTNLEHDSAGRIKAKDNVSGEEARLNNLTFNGIPDVYSFLFKGVTAGDVLQVQLNSGVAGEDPSIAGIMFDVVPEPTSAALLLLGGVFLGLADRRRR